MLEESGRSTCLAVLEARARTFRGLLAGERVDDLAEGPIDLGGNGDLTRGYEAGNIAAITYAGQAVPNDDALIADLRRFLALCKVLVESSDRLAEDADPAALAVAAAAGMEAQRERWHKRTERNPRLARDAKRILGTTCMVCGFNFEARYGEIGVGFIEAHHLTPFTDLQGRPTQLDRAPREKSGPAPTGMVAATRSTRHRKGDAIPLRDRVATSFDCHAARSLRL